MITQNHIAEFLALAISIIYLPSLRKGKLYWLPFFLLAILLVELTGSFLPRVLGLNNVGLYNVSIPFEYLFYLFLFWKHGNKLLRKFTEITAVLLVCITLFYFLTVRNSVFHNYVLLAGQLFVIAACCIYLYEQFQDTENSSLLKNYFFFITAGLMLFNLGELSYSLLFPAIRDKKWDDFGYLFRSINNSLLLMLYLSYILAIIIHKKYSVPNA